MKLRRMPNASPLRIVIFLYNKDTEKCIQDESWLDKHPLGGTEASAIRMAQALRELGHDAVATTRVEELQRKPDVFVSTRFWQLFEKGLHPGRLNYLWCHDDVDQPMVKPLADKERAAKVYASVDGAMVISDYQARRWQEHLNLGEEKIFLTTNGIPSERFLSLHPEPKGRYPRAYYGSTPFRGLHHAIQRWPSVRRRVPQAELHVFSSMQIYGVPDTAELEALYKQAMDTEGIVYHGAQGQQMIRETAITCRALAYPCIFPETCCITAMEAMAAGCAVVSTTLGALPVTAAGNPLVPPQGKWLDAWEENLVRVLSDDAFYGDIAAANLELTEGRDWKKVAETWVERFRRKLKV